MRRIGCVAAWHRAYHSVIPAFWSCVPVGGKGEKVAMAIWRERGQHGMLSRARACSHGIRKGGERVIEAWIFDLDGTLVQTERLKALSYARAAIELRPGEIDEDEVLEAFKQVVGRSRQEVAEALLERFGLREAARARVEQYGVHEPWQAFVQIRLGYYHAMLEDPQVLLANQWPHNMALLQAARQAGCKVALVTMSTCEQARHVLRALRLAKAFDFVATRDDVEFGKPNPEIYHLALRALKVPADRAVAIEDSAVGVQAALAAGVHVVAVATPFTREGLHALGSLPPEWIVDEAQALPQVVQRIVDHELHHGG